MFDHMHPHEPVFDEENQRWDLTVTGNDPEDILFTVHSKESSLFAQRRAYSIIAGIQAYSNAMRMMGDIASLPADQQGTLWDALAERRAHADPISMRGPKLAPDLPPDNPIRQMIKDAIKPDDNNP